MKLAFAIVLCLVLIFVCVQIVSFLGQEHTLNQSLSDVQKRLTQAQTDEADLEAETQYLANPINLEKELREDFNYKKPGETMMIIVSAQSSSPSSTP